MCSGSSLSKMGEGQSAPTSPCQCSLILQTFIGYPMCSRTVLNAEVKMQNETDQILFLMELIF